MIFNLSETDKKAFNLIRNKLIHTSQKPTLREINEITGGRSPRSASLVIDRLVAIGLLKKVGSNLRLTEKAVMTTSSIETVDVPLVGTVTCGLPMLATENIEALIPVSTNLTKKGISYFLLRANGDSMNQAGIQNRDIVLVRQQNTAEDGQRVVALIDDEATLKILERRNGLVILRPKSTNKMHKPIVLTENCQIQGVVVSVLPRDLI